ncbi:unnamed protein product [Euphydryas editha]|nr:unnamed protein product [Euphydryas editha]
MVAFSAATELYSTENDHLDIEAVVSDPTSLKAFLDCFNDKGSCDEQMADFKKDIPEAVAENCAKCTEAQKHIFKRFLEVIKVKNPEDYQVFKQKYDPQDKHFAKLETAIANF